VRIGKEDESGMTRKQDLQNQQESDAWKPRKLMKGKCKAIELKNMILQWVALVHWRRMVLNKIGE
jgi:hypothetical protein